MTTPSIIEALKKARASIAMLTRPAEVDASGQLTELDNLIESLEQSSPAPKTRVTWDNGGVVASANVVGSGTIFSAKIKHRRAVRDIISRALAGAGLAAPCIDNGCIFGRPGGMATNGGCRCFDRVRQDPAVASATVRALAGVVLELATHLAPHV